jgi:hypothetical protein
LRFPDRACFDPFLLPTPIHLFKDQINGITSRTFSRTSRDSLIETEGIKSSDTASFDGVVGDRGQDVDSDSRSNYSEVGDHCCGGGRERSEGDRLTSVRSGRGGRGLTDLAVLDVLETTSHGSKLSRDVTQAVHNTNEDVGEKCIVIGRRRGSSEEVRK